MIMMPYGGAWSSLQLTGHADFWHPTALTAPCVWLRCEVRTGRTSRPCGHRECIKGPFWRLCADVGRRSAPGLRKAITRDHFLQQQQRHPPRQPRDPRRGDRAPGSQGGSGGARDTPRWCDVSTPPVVRFENEASAQSLTEQDIDDRLARGAVISYTALAIRQAKARPGFGTRAPCTRTRQVAGAGEAQLAQAVGQSRGARC